MAYSQSNAESKVASGSRSEPHRTQYQLRRIWYQPLYPRPVANDPGRSATIEAVATNPAHPQPARHDAAENLRDTRLMIKTGLLLGIGYLLFLTLWFWATRVRQRPTRAGGGIDTGRRID
jgi:hypothetical protein